MDIGGRLVLLLLSLYRAFATEEGESCVSNQGWKGLCILSYDCAQLGDLVIKGYTPELCNTSGPIICCPVTSQINNNELKGSSTPPTPSFFVSSIAPPVYNKKPQNMHSMSQYKPSRRRPVKKRMPSFVVKTYDDEVNSIRIRTHRVKTSPRRKRKPMRPRGPSPHYHKKSHHSSKSAMMAAVSPYPVIDPEAALLFGDMSEVQSTVRPVRMVASKRPAESRCDAFSEIVTETVAELSKGGVVPRKTEKCSVASVHPMRVSSGDAVLGEYPHVVGIGYSDASSRTLWGKCSGALISEEWVLTSAHCTHAPIGRPLSVGLGAATLDESLEIQVSDIVIHPNYNKTTYANDLALLKLSKVPQMSDTLRPACLYSSKEIPRGLMATHWATLPQATLEITLSENATHTFSDPDSLGLRKERVSTLKTSECGLASDIASSFVCVQSDINRRSSSVNECQGFGGDVLQVRAQENKCVYQVIGIAVENVCEESVPIAFTRVATYLSWIESVVWPLNV